MKPQSYKVDKARCSSCVFSRTFYASCFCYFGEDVIEGEVNFDNEVCPYGTCEEFKERL
jgi:hypothetical protein